MRILYFTRDYNTHDHRFLAAFAGTDHEVGYIQMERSRNKLEGRPLPEKIRKIEWDGGKKPTRYSDIPKLVNGLKKVIHDFDPDLIQAGPVQRAAFITALAGFHPLVTMSWGYDLLMDVNKNFLWKWATRYTLQNSDALVGDCRTIRNLAESFGMHPERIITFPWGANIKKYSPVNDKWQTDLRKNLDWGKERFVLLSTRVWSDLYGIEDLANAFVQIFHLVPEIRLLMLGNGPLENKVKQIFSEGGVSEFVQFPGQVSQDELPKYYQAADLYISTSHSDGTSISLLEALASGTPVLLTDIPGNKEWVDSPGKIGWLFKDGDVDSLVTGILFAIENHQSLPEMGRNARKTAETRADWEKNFPKLFKAYEIALS